MELTEEVTPITEDLCVKEVAKLLNRPYTTVSKKVRRHNLGYTRIGTGGRRYLTNVDIAILRDKLIEETDLYKENKHSYFREYPYVKHPKS